jgi:ribonuclease Z
MKPTFIHGLVNSPPEDPSLFVRILRERRALLFDIGNISRLAPGDLQKITDVFVTHTHIDHFIGFDTLLRALLRREKPLRIYGPSNITECIEGKLKGYTWNLIQGYPLRIEVFSIHSDTVRSSSFYAGNRFRRIDNGSTVFDGLLLKDPLFSVKAALLNHQIPCIGFLIEEEFHININKDLLNEMGLPVGPWLSELKKAIRENEQAYKEFFVAGRRFMLGELAEVATITKGQKIAYVTDVAATDENIHKIIDFVRESDTFYCEAYFLDQDRDRAFERFHLTAKITGAIAREAKVKNLVVMHFSPKYRGEADGPAAEALREMKNPAANPQSS